MVFQNQKHDLLTSKLSALTQVAEVLSALEARLYASFALISINWPASRKSVQC